MKLIVAIGVALLVAVGAQLGDPQRAIEVRPAGQLNQDANALAADAAKTIGVVIGSTVQR